MKLERQIEEMEKLDKDGRYGFLCVKCGDIDGLNTTYDETCAICGLPVISCDDYLNDLNACNRVLCGLDGRDDVSIGAYHKFIYELEQIMDRWYCTGYNDETFIASDYFPLATAAQVTEAILKATGKWEQSK